MDSWVLGRQRAAEEAFASRTTFIEADVCRTGLPSAAYDFVWGEDAWCYVEDKPALIAEAARLLRPGGIMAFTDWMEGPQPMTVPEADRYLTFMKFPSLLTLAEYTALIERNHCNVRLSQHRPVRALCFPLPRHDRKAAHLRRPEACGGRFCGSDFMVGPACDRARRIVDDCRRFRIEAIVIARIPGASHCPWEGSLIRQRIQAELGLPVVDIEIPPVCDALLPTLRTRIEAVLEIARARREI